MSNPLRITGAAAIALAIAFNIPFSMLAARFDYPAILRQPAGKVLEAFAAGGSPLILIWYAFMLSAVAMAPLAIAMAFARPDWSLRPIAAIGAAVTGALAGLAQAIGLSRWVFLVPSLAAAHADPAIDPAGRAVSEAMFAMANQWGGVAIGEHLGQIFTCLWVLHALTAQFGRGTAIDRIAAGLGVVTILGIGLGLGEGLAVTFGEPAALFGLSTMIGYLAFTAWLIVSGLGLISAARRALPA